MIRNAGGACHFLYSNKEVTQVEPLEMIVCSLIMLHLI